MIPIGLLTAIRTRNEKRIQIEMENVEEEGYEKYLQVIIIILNY